MNEQQITMAKPEETNGKCPPQASVAHAGLMNASPADSGCNLHTGEAPVSTGTQIIEMANAREIVLDMAGEGTSLRKVVGGPITEALSDWLASRYAVEARECLGVSEGLERMEILRTFVRDWYLLRRNDHSASRLKIQREKLELAQRDKIDAGLVALGEEIRTNRKALEVYQTLRATMGRADAAEQEAPCDPAAMI